MGHSSTLELQSHPQGDFTSPWAGLQRQQLPPPPPAPYGHTCPSSTSLATNLSRAICLQQPPRARDGPEPGFSCVGFPPHHPQCFELPLLLTPHAQVPRQSSALGDPPPPGWLEPGTSTISISIGIQSPCFLATARPQGLWVLHPWPQPHVQSLSKLSPGDASLRLLRKEHLGFLIQTRSLHHCKNSRFYIYWANFATAENQLLSLLCIIYFGDFSHPKVTKSTKSS